MHTTTSWFRRLALTLAVLLAALLGALVTPAVFGPRADAAVRPATAGDGAERAAGAEDAEGGELQTFGIGPADADGLDRRGVFVFAGRPGTVVRDQLALVNYTTKPRRVSLYAADAFTSASGAFDVLAAGEASQDAATWIDLPPREVVIPARRSETTVKPGTLLVPFTLTVPVDASPGDHAAGFVASVRTDAAEGTSSVVLDRRVGTRVYVQVTGRQDPHLEVTDLTAEYDGTPNPIGTGTTRVSYTVRNAGNLVLSARQSTRVEGWFSEASPETAQSDLVQLLPGAAVKVQLEVPGTWPTLRPEAVVTLVPFSGVGAQAVDLEPVSASVAFWAVPWTLLATIAVLVLLLLGRTWWRRTRTARDGPDGPLHAPAPELVDA